MIDARFCRASSIIIHHSWCGCVPVESRWSLYDRTWLDLGESLLCWDCLNMIINKVKERSNWSWSWFFSMFLEVRWSILQLEKPPAELRIASSWLQKRQVLWRWWLEAPHGFCLRDFWEFPWNLCRKLSAGDESDHFWPHDLHEAMYREGQQWGSPWCHGSSSFSLGIPDAQPFLCNFRDDMSQTSIGVFVSKC